MDSNIERWYSMKEICEYLGVSRDTVLDWIERRNMPAAKIGRLWKFKVSEIDAWMKSGVAAEVLCLPKAAIGTQVYYSKIYLETPSLFAWTAVVIVLSMLLERIVRRLLGAKGGRKA